MPRTPYVAVVGPGDASAPELQTAEEVGAGHSAPVAVVVTGGLGGVMEAACRGARARPRPPPGVLPRAAPAAPPRGGAHPVAPRLGELRNGLVVRAADALVAIGGGHGTLSEIALALKLGRPVVGLGTWAVHGVEQVSTPADALSRIERLLAR